MKVKISWGRTPKIGYYTKLSHCKKNWDFSCKIWQKWPFSSAKKWHFERPNLRTDSKNPAKHPPKWWGRLLVHAFPFSSEYQAIFWKLQILAPLGALLPLWLSQTQKWTAEYRLWVYNSEIWFLGSPNLSAPLVFWALKNSKVGQKRYGLVITQYRGSVDCPAQHTA